MRISQGIGAAAFGLVGALAVAGCGSGGSSYGPATSPTTAVQSSTPSGQEAGSGIHVAHTSLGDVLVDSTGRTLYLLTADTPGKSTCAGACASIWPPVAPPASGVKLSGVTAPVASTTTPDGASIVTVGGQPLYTYAQDQAPGGVTGEGIQSFGGTWYAVSAAGKQVSGGSSSTGSSGDGGGNGYGY